MTRVLIAISTIALLSGCSTPTAKDVWNDVLERCAASDLNGPRILFFGPSNGAGTGSIWRKASNGTFRLRYDLQQMPAVLPDQQYIGAYTPTSCVGRMTSNFGVGLSGSSGNPALPASLKTKIDRARTVSGDAEKVAWVPIAEGRYEEYIDVNSSSPASQDLSKPNRYVLTRAFKVTGFKLKVEFSNANAAEVRAEFPSGTIVDSSLGGQLNLDWTQEGTLEMTSSEDFYIAGELQPFDGSLGFAVESSRFGDVEIINESSSVSLNDDEDEIAVRDVM